MTVTIWKCPGCGDWFEDRPGYRNVGHWCPAKNRMVEFKKMELEQEQEGSGSCR